MIFQTLIDHDWWQSITGAFTQEINWRVAHGWMLLLGCLPKSSLVLVVVLEQFLNSKNFSYLINTHTTSFEKCVFTYCTILLHVIISDLLYHYSIIMIIVKNIISFVLPLCLFHLTWIAAAACCLQRLLYFEFSLDL